MSPRQKKAAQNHEFVFAIALLLLRTVVVSEECSCFGQRRFG